MARRDLTSSAAARAVALVAVLLLAAAVVALSLLALQRGDAPNADATPRPVPSFAYDQTEPTASAAPSPSSAAATASAPGAAERMLAVASEGTLWRATAGSCGDGDGVAPLVETSTDDGASWQDVTPRYRGIGQVRALTGLAGTEGEMIADIGADCETQWLRTFTQGRFWEPYPDLLDGATYLSRADPSAMVTPDGEVAMPCAQPWGLHVGSLRAAAVCDAVAHTRAADGDWQALPWTGVVAVDIVGDATVAVHTGAAACPDGVAVSRATGDGTADDAISLISCVAGVDAAAPVAVAALDDDVWVWHADTVVPVS